MCNGQRPKMNLASTAISQNNTNSISTEAHRNTGKVKPPLCLFKYCAMNACGGEKCKPSRIVNGAMGHFQASAVLPLYLTRDWVDPG
jgi:hypothetical protein